MFPGMASVHQIGVEGTECKAKPHFLPSSLLSHETVLTADPEGKTNSFPSLAVGPGPDGCC